MNEERKLHPTKNRRTSSIANINTNNRIAQTISSTVPTVLLILDRITGYTDEKVMSSCLSPRFVTFPVLCKLQTSDRNSFSFGSYL